MDETRQLPRGRILALSGALCWSARRAGGGGGGQGVEVGSEAEGDEGAGIGHEAHLPAVVALKFFHGGAGGVIPVAARALEVAGLHQRLLDLAGAGGSDAGMRGRVARGGVMLPDGFGRGLLRLLRGGGNPEQQGERERPHRRSFPALACTATSGGGGSVPPSIQRLTVPSPLGRRSTMATS